ncbi:MAG: hypothetical protein NZ959_09260 [Armatimonadetes bacterium]|nr:hypothetical protein [Armatimonadota bacterium]MDW8122622.1 hypothetical protein [Armatimonadota bacterium]
MAAITVVFQNGLPAKEGEPIRFQPGQQMLGEVVLRPQKDVTCRHLWVGLRWRTEGRGDFDSEEINRVDLFQGTLRGGTVHSFPFAFALPQQPWSYSGVLVKIIWEISVEVDIPWAINLRHQQPFLLLPHPPDDATS